MSTRLNATTARLKAANETGLVTFIMAGDPDENTAQAVLDGLPAAGADIIELGMPFSDPMADGPIIQAAGQRALSAGMTLKKTLAMVQQFRTKNSDTPIILMGYYNPVYHYGVEAFCKDAVAAGVDGLILVDLPPEEEAELTPYLGELDFIRLIAPTTDDARLPNVVKHASGFVYAISVAGITGAGTAHAADVAAIIARTRTHTTLPIALGFGIKTPDDVKAAAKHADLVVVGSAIIKALESGGVDAALQLVTDLKTGCMP